MKYWFAQKIQSSSNSILEETASLISNKQNQQFTVNKSTFSISCNLSARSTSRPQKSLARQEISSSTDIVAKVEVVSHDEAPSKHGRQI